MQHLHVEFGLILMSQTPEKVILDKHKFYIDIYIYIYNEIPPFQKTFTFPDYLLFYNN
jgi:hypothetical protein